MFRNLSGSLEQCQKLKRRPIRHKPFDCSYALSRRYKYCFISLWGSK